jgi:glycosyltransferase involved in cell wall biosynthesis
MKVIVSTAAKFHSFHLAEELQKRGCLARLMTSYYDPERNGKGYDIDPSLVRTHFPSAMLTYAHRVIPQTKNLPFRSQLAHEVYDRWAARNLPQGDIVIAWSGWALHTHRAAKKQGMITVVERGSSHIAYQREILAREYEELGVDGELPSNYILAKEMQEYAEADYISIPSTFVRRSFTERGVPEKLVQVPYGVSLEHFRPVPKEDNVFRVMHIGGTVQKGTHYLIQAMRELNLDNSELLLVGSPNSRLQAMINQYEGNCKLISYVPHLELHKTYSQSSVYVLPSIQEGLAMVQAEAMACGVPVICSINTGGEDIICDGADGFVVPARDVEALKEKILYLYEHEAERRAMGRSALKRAQEFTWDRYGERIVEIYRELSTEEE